MSVQPEIWVERPATAVDFYERAFGARVLHRVGDGEDIIAQLAVGEGAFWVGSAAENMGRFSPAAIEGGTCRILLTVDDPDAFVERAVGAGATKTSPIAEEHGWRLGRIVDPFGHEWEIGRPPAVAVGVVVASDQRAALSHDARRRSAPLGERTIA